MRLTIYFFSFSSSLILFFFLSHGVNCDDIIHDTCKKAVTTDPLLNYEFCVASLQSDPKSYSSDLHGLGLISMKLIIANGTCIDSYIKKLLNDTSGDSRAKQYLQDCEELYSDAIPNVNDAITSFNSKDYYQANIQISSAMDASSTCEDGFKEKNLKSPLTKENDVFNELTKISLAIINMFP